MSFILEFGTSFFYMLSGVIWIQNTYSVQILNWYAAVPYTEAGTFTADNAY